MKREVTGSNLGGVNFFLPACLSRAILTTLFGLCLYFVTAFLTYFHDYELSKRDKRVNHRASSFISGP